MCLSTGQVIVIILILLVLLALVSGLIVVVYRRRLLLAAHRLRLETNDDFDTTPTQTPVDALCKGSLMQHHHHQQLILQQRQQHHQLQYQPQHQLSCQHQQHAGSGHCSLPRLSPSRGGGPLAEDGGAVVEGGGGGGAPRRAYATLPTADRAGCGLAIKEHQQHQQLGSRYCSSELAQLQNQQHHQRLCQAAAQLLDNRPDVCTCDRSLPSSYSITSSQV